MERASSVAYLNLKRIKREEKEESYSESEEDMNVTVVTFEGMKDAEKNLSGGDPYDCKACRAIFSRYSVLADYELDKNKSLWICEFCNQHNIIGIEKGEIPSKDDLYYMLEPPNAVQGVLDSTLVFCIDSSGSMNSTSAIEGKVELKYGVSEEEYEMLKQFMDPGDEAQLNFLPGLHNKNKTFISRRQCILSAVEAQIEEITKKEPSKRIGIVAFNNEVTVVGDSHSPTINLVGDKLQQEAELINSVEGFVLHDPIGESHKTLLNTLRKMEAKGQTALGPALLASLHVAAKGSPGSSVLLCTDGLANVGVGQLEPVTEEGRDFYCKLGQYAKQRNITVNIMTIKGEGCKMEVIGQMADITNGNMKVVNPDKLADEFANILKDEVVGINVVVKIMLHKALQFRNEPEECLKENKRVLEKVFPNATKNTRLSFEYEVRPAIEIGMDVTELKSLPFQAQIEFTSAKGGRLLRVITVESMCSSDKAVTIQQVNLGVVHQRITAQTAAIYAKGDYVESKKFNEKWENYLADNFQGSEYEEQAIKFATKNERLRKAIRHKHRKSVERKIMINFPILEEEKEVLDRSLTYNMDSDDDELELKDNLRERQEYSISEKSAKGKKRKESRKKSRSSKRLNISVSSGSSSEEILITERAEKRERKNSIEKIYNKHLQKYENASSYKILNTSQHKKEENSQNNCEKHEFPIERKNNFFNDSPIKITDNKEERKKKLRRSESPFSNASL